MDKSIRNLAEKLSALASGRKQSVVSVQLAQELDASLKREEGLLHTVKEKEDELKRIKNTKWYDKDLL